MPILKQNTQAPTTLVGLFSALLTLSTALFLWRTWGRWGDIQVDFGRELYIAWQISQGKVLYRDLAYFNGPLSPYLNALVMWLTSTSLTSVIVNNISILLATCLLIGNLARNLSSAFTALVAVFFFLATSACNAISGISNYNSLSPYSHELTHGLLLLFVGLSLVIRFAKRPTAFTGFLGGLVIGLGFLTKPEMAVAIATSVGCGLTLVLAKNTLWPVNYKTSITSIVAGMALPPLVALTALSLGMPFGKAVEGLTLMWRLAASTDVSSLLFYRNVTGLSAPDRNLTLACLSLGLHAVALGYITCLGLVFSRCRTVWLGYVLATTLLVVTYGLLSPQQRLEIILLLPRAWPFLILAFAIFLAIKILRHTAPCPPSLIAQLSLFIAASALSFKIFLNSTFFHYGALLLVPAGVAFTTNFVDLYPKCFSSIALRHYLSVCAALFCLLITVPLVEVTTNNLMAKEVLIQTPYGAITTDRRGIFLTPALEFMLREAKPQETVAVLPEGAMLNFLGGYVNSTPYTTLMPPEWLLYGAQTIEASFSNNPPDWIVLIHKSTAEYGYDFFGKGYGQNLWAFIRDNYVEQALFGNRPLQDNRFGVLILRRIHPKRTTRTGGEPGN